MNEQEAHNLTELANSVFNTAEKAQKWLHYPLTSLEDQTPVAVASQSAEGYALITERLKRMHVGMCG